MKVKLAEIIEALEMTDNYTEYFLDMETGEIECLNDMVMSPEEREEIGERLDVFLLNLTLMITRSWMILFKLFPESHMHLRIPQYRNAALSDDLEMEFGSWVSKKITMLIRRKHTDESLLNGARRTESNTKINQIRKTDAFFS